MIPKTDQAPVQAPAPKREIAQEPTPKIKKVEPVVADSEEMDF